ncbi:MAG: 3'-5' exonuclease, partial [Bdellovibrionota bacterium]
VGGMSFLDRKEIKDALAYWRLIVNPKDDASARRIINWPTRGIGKTTVERASTLATANGSTFMEALRKIAEDDGSTTPPARGIAPIRAFLKTIDRLRADLEALPLTGEALSRWGREFLDRIEFKRGIDEDHEEPAKAQMRWDSVVELAHALGQMPVASLAAQEETASRESSASTGAAAQSAPAPVIALREYLARLALQAQDEREEREKNDREAAADGTLDEITLLTLHGAKGLEFPVVFLVGMEDGFLPHQRSIDEGQDLSEERRLCYVGITRAKERLFLTRASQRLRWGKTVPRNPSRFLAEIPPELLLQRGNHPAAAPHSLPGYELRVKNILSAIKRGIPDPNKPRSK